MDWLIFSCSFIQYFEVSWGWLNLFFKKNKINLRVQDDYFPITKNKINKLNVRFNSSFGRHLEYYTGLVFKIDIKSKSQKLNIRGGRYDSLIKDLGFKKNIPAVGAAINLEKLWVIAS